MAALLNANPVQSETGEEVYEPSDTKEVITWQMGLPFALLHLSFVTVFLVGWSPAAVVVGVVSYVARAFGITGFYHRCFAHRAFRVSRQTQFFGALLGASAGQQGPLWWVAHHRRHHRYTEQPGDPHSPVVLGFLAAHMLWIFAPSNTATDTARVQDLAEFPELRFLDKFHYVASIGTGALCFGLGEVLSWLAPGLHTSGWQLVVWGFVLPTLVLYHSTFAVNSFAHRWGRRRFETKDESRNNWYVAALTLGEGWHNNHHQFPNSARQGLSRFEIDPTWMVIRTMQFFHLASEVRRAPTRAMAIARPSREDRVAARAARSTL